jgi:hypothetical protein
MPERMRYPLNGTIDENHTGDKCCGATFLRVMLG